MLVTRGILRSSRVLCAGGPPQTNRAAVNYGRPADTKHWYDFGNPWRDDYPDWIWRSLRYSRKDKDMFAPLYRALNSTRLYELFFKEHARYWVFIMIMGMTTSWLWSEMWNMLWRRVNKGKLYNDLPYVYPKED